MWLTYICMRFSYVYEDGVLCKWILIIALWACELGVRLSKGFVSTMWLKFTCSVLDGSVHIGNFGDPKVQKGWNMIPQSFAFFPFAISLCCHFFYPPTSLSQQSSVPWYGLVFFRPESVGGIDLARSEGSQIKISIAYPNLDLRILPNFRDPESPDRSHVTPAVPWTLPQTLKNRINNEYW